MLTTGTDTGRPFRYPQRTLADYEIELDWLIARAASDGVTLPMVRDAKRWQIWSKASADASGLDTPVGDLPFFRALFYYAGFSIKKRFTADQLGCWVDTADAEVAKEASCKP